MTDSLPGNVDWRASSWRVTAEAIGNGFYIDFGEPTFYRLEMSRDAARKLAEAIQLALYQTEPKVA